MSPGRLENRPKFISTVAAVVSVICVMNGVCTNRDIMVIQALLILSFTVYSYLCLK